MSERDGPRAGRGSRDDAPGFLEEGWNIGDGHADVMLDRAALEALRFRQFVAQAPEIASLALRGRKGRVLDQFALSRLREQSQHALARIIRVLRAQFHERVPAMRISQRIACAARVGEHEIEPDARDQFKSGDQAARPVAREFKQRDGVFWRSEPDEGGRDCSGLGKQLQDRRRDDFERALRTDEKIFEIIAGIVLLSVSKDRRKCARRRAPPRRRARDRARSHRR